METLYDYKQYAVLYIDDEEMSLKYFSKAFGGTFRIMTATSAEEGYKILQAHADDIGVVMSDQRMPGEKGTKLLEKARQLRPRIIRILATAFSDLEAAIDAVNTGAIYKYVTKPWDIPVLETTLKRGLEFFIVQRERDMLVREKLSILHGVVVTDRVLSLGVLAAGVTTRVRNGMSAVQAFLDVVPDRNRRMDLDLHQLRQPSLWRDFQDSVKNRVRLALDLLNPPAPDGNWEFKDSIAWHSLVNDAAATALPELESRRISIQNQVPAAFPATRGDRQRLSRLLGCLLRNAIMRLPEGGSVNFQAAQGTDSAGQPTAEITIRDPGPGLPEDGILALFDPFQSKSSPLAEYGVYLLAAFFIAHHHGGTIAVSRTPDGGLEHRISIPVQPPESLPALEPDRFIVQAIMNDRLWEKLLIQ